MRDGSAITGNVIIIDKDPVTGEKVEVDCSKFGTGGYNIPNSVEHFSFKTKAKFILAIENIGYVPTVSVPQILENLQLCFSKPERCTLTCNSSVHS